MRLYISQKPIHVGDELVVEDVDMTTVRKNRLAYSVISKDVQVLAYKPVHKQFEILTPEFLSRSKFLDYWNKNYGNFIIQHFSCYK